MKERLSSRMERLSESKTLRMARLSREMINEGHDVINLSLGEPDFNTPEHIREAAKKAIDDGYTYYPPVAGYPDLREAIANKFISDYGLDVSDKNVVVSTGAKQSLANLIMTLIDFEDEVLLPAPYWVTYPEQVNLAGGKVKSIPTSVESDFKINAEQLDDALSQDTRVFLFSSPSNPTGSIYTKHELAEMVEVIEKYPNLIVISDEIYELINFVGKHESISQFSEIADRVVIVNGVSKGYSMTGWRIGYIVAPLWIAQACEKIQGQFTSGANTIAQKAAKAAIEGDNVSTKKMTEKFKERRDFLLEKMQSESRLKISCPTGAFYLFMDVSALYGTSFGEFAIDNSEDLAMYLLKHAKVSMVAGDAFGTPECMRISFAASMEQLSEAADRILKALAELS